MPPNPIKLYLDEDTIRASLIDALRFRGVDVLTAQEAHLIGRSDSEQLEFATSLNRTLFTFNVGDFVQLHTQYMVQSKFHTGIVVATQGTVSMILRPLLNLVNSRSAIDMHNWLEYLSNWR